MILPMQALRSSSLGVSWSSGLGKSVNDTHGIVVCLLFKIVHLEFLTHDSARLDYKFFIKKW